jgi:hypothetical protein
MLAAAFVAAMCVAVSADVTFDMTVLQTGQCYACGVYAVGDIDGDGKNDIVAGQGSPRLVWYPYPISTSNKHTIASSAYLGFEIHLGDVDNDGDLDVMSSGAGITWWENPLKPDGDPAAGGWQAHTFGSYGTNHNGGSHDFKVGDINGDGWIDGVERVQNTVPYVVYLQNGTGGWTTFNVNATRSGEGTWLGDVDLDGDLDLTDGWAWFECPSNPASGTWTRHDIGNATHNLTRAVIVDIDEDGDMDIVSSPTEFGGSKLIWWEGPADPKSGPWIEHALTNYNDPNFHTLQVGDIDLDGHLDIFVGSTHGQCSVPKLLWIFYNVNGDGSSWEEQKWNTPGGCWQGILGDVGSDGDLDILTADYGDGNQGEFWENKTDPPTYARQEAAGMGSRALTPSTALRILVKTGAAAAAPYVAIDAGVQASPRLFDIRGREVLP